MCGIVGYAGRREAQPILLDCLGKLEYRGYDSCGIATSKDHIETYKQAVRVETLNKECPVLHGMLGIGHTRWATHGIPNAVNAHPHFDCTKRIAVVHNGIVRNYQALRQQLSGEGHVLLSETDTEVIPHLIEKYYNGDLLKAVEDALSRLEGTFAVAILMEGHEELIVGRKDSPLIIGLGDGENLVASDVPAILNYTNKVIYLEDGDIASISRDSVKVMQNHTKVDRPEKRVTWDKNETSKSGFDYFMLKEIREQVKVMRDSLVEPLNKDSNFDSAAVLNSGLNDLLLIACGTSYHAGLIGKYVIEELLGIPVRVELGSEFNHRNRLIIPSLVIAITQSGETADVLIPLKKLKQARAKTLVITNVPGSTASRLADYNIFTRAGPEVSVAATKTFIAQLMEIYKMVLSSQIINPSITETLTNELRQIPAQVQRILDKENQIIDCANFIKNFKTVFFVGRGVNYPIALEGALKLKEIAYIHAEGYAAGELKHGPFALLDKNTPVIAILSRDETYDSMISNIKEIKARQSPVIALAEESDEDIDLLADMIIRVPHVANILSPMVNVVPLQLIAYHTAKYRGCPIDYPRNLAKSVTVE
jgi:glucosamine--fructose-6-phosphate aminotransferase (isomerizing)